MWITSQRNQFRMNINSLKAYGKAYTFEYVTVLIYIILPHPCLPAGRPAYWYTGNALLQKEKGGVSVSSCWSSN